MQDAKLRPNSARFAVVLFSALLVLVNLALPNRVRGQSAVMVAATSSHRGVAVSVSCHAERKGEGRLTLEILDPHDLVVGKSQRTVEISVGDTKFEQDIATDKPIALDDLVWYRLRYHLRYADGSRNVCEAVDSISQILRRPTVHILGQKAYLSGSEAAIRVIVRDSQDDHPIPGQGSLRIDLLADGKNPRALFSGALNRRGTTEAQFRFPANLAGSYQLHYVVETSIGSAEYTQTVELEDKVSILLTTEKPIYQPGQAIHVRALALNRADRHAVADRDMTFELEDSHGNKVFRKATHTDKFGIASADFELADEVNLGIYHLRSLMGNENAAPTNSAEIALTVERYVLPKFKTVIDFAEKGGKAQRDYRPGDHVVGTVHANYFFGKPVDGAAVEVKVSSLDVSVNEAGKQNGKTDKDGVYHFDLKLPDYFAGLPLTNGAAQVLIEATVKDSANHAETRGEAITVTSSPLLFTAIPEGGSLIPHLDNQVFILTSYPDGTPAKTDLVVEAAGMADQRVSTDTSGIAVVRVKATAKEEALKIDGDDHQGARASSNVALRVRDGDDQILLRTNRAVFRAGDPIQLKVFSTETRGTAYVDIVKDGQTIMTRDLDIANGEADITLTATPEMAGTLDINAYLFGRNAQPIGDHRLVFIQPADELKIETTTDAAEYKPGGDARVHFRVTNSRGQGVRAALGLQVVDEAVFALAEKQPGFAKVFFYLEQEVMKPRYEIHSLSMNRVVQNEPASPVPGAIAEQQARALFAATEIVNANKVQTEFGTGIPQTKFSDNMQQYRIAFAKYVQGLGERLNAEYVRNPNAGDLLPLLAKMTEPDGSKLHDAWGNDLDAGAAGWSRAGVREYFVKSPGADRRFNTADDVVVYLELRKNSDARSTTQPGLSLTIEHDRGAFNGRAAVTGMVQDPSGAAIPGAKVQLTATAGKQIINVITDGSGRFDLSALSRGSYKIEISAPGFDGLSQKFTLDPRDRAVISAALKVGAATTTVQVDATPVAGFANGVAGGVGGMAPGVGNGTGAGGGIGAANGGNFGVGRFRAGVDVTNTQPLLHTEDSSISVSFTAEQPQAQNNGGPPAHVRSYFPEALYINPEILTDGSGAATITIPLADSITTWRMAMLASTESGALGSSVSSLKVFQDFFVDLDLPVTLTQGDRVSIPVAVYNYRDRRGAVDLKLQPDDWFSLVDDVADKNVSVDSGQVGSSQFTVEAKRIGKFKLTLSATMAGGDRSDVVVREIEVVPNGREQNLVFNGRLEKTVQHALTFPIGSIPDASTIFVRLYPGPLSQVIEGMDSILQMPGGCFEQTSSSTYPNVLALDYMKRTKKLTPEVHAKAEGYIANGYQRLLTFEVPGGGFSWFGQAPANKILTAYGLMEFSDMAKVYDVDPNVIRRTQAWLANQQQPDGSWKPDTQFINEGATIRYNTDVLRITAYIAWALEDTGFRGPVVDKAKQYIESQLASGIDTYTLAVVANFAVDFGTDRDFTRRAMQLLLDAHTEKDEQAWWTDQQTPMYSTGASATTETTALAVQALLKWEQASGVARKAMTYIASKKDAAGNWGTTQATIMALRALLLASERGPSDVKGAVEVLLNGRPVEQLTLNADNNDLLHQFVLKGMDATQVNTVELRFDGDGGLAYQVVGRYFIPWTATTAQEALSINVSYDRTELARNDIATETVAIHNNLAGTANMVMVDIGIPPGFDLLTEDLQNFQQSTAASKSGRLEKFSLTATQAILYFNALNPQESVTLHCRLRAKYPIRAKTAQSRVYEYYDPDVKAVAGPTQMVVTDH